MCFSLVYIAKLENKVRLNLQTKRKENVILIRNLVHFLTILVHDVEVGMTKTAGSPTN